MTTQSSHTSPILVTGAAGAVGSIGRNLTEMLLAKGHKVRALVRREDKRAEALRQLGAEVMQGDLTDLTAMHRPIEGCVRVYLGMSVSADYLAATVITATPPRQIGVNSLELTAPGSSFQPCVALPGRDARAQRRQADNAD